MYQREIRTVGFNFTADKLVQILVKVGTTMIKIFSDIIVYGIQTHFSSEIPTIELIGR